MVHETSEINYYMNPPLPIGQRLHTVTARVDRVLFPDGSELESSDQLLTTEDLTTLAAQLARWSHSNSNCWWGELHTSVRARRFKGDG